MGIPPSAQELAEQDAGYSAAIERVYKAIRPEWSHLFAQRAKARKALAGLETGGLEALGKVPRDTKGLALYKTLLSRSWALRHENPGLMVQFASLATQVAAKLAAGRYGEKRIADFQCRAWMEYGNALRVADRLAEAEFALGRAVEFHSRGTDDELLAARLLELQASLAADRRRFALACRALSFVRRYYFRVRDRHLAGRTLIKQGLYTGYAGDTQEGLRLLRRGLSLIDGSYDPALVCAALHNQLLFLIDQKSFRDARKLLFQNRQRLSNSGGKINELKMLWLEGRIEAGFGKHGRAERILQKVKEGFDQAGLGYQAAIASLDLAAALLSQNRVAEAQELVVKAARVFSALGIGREAMGAILLLRQSFDLRAATVAFIEEVTVFLRKVENDPLARFDPQ